MMDQIPTIMSVVIVGGVVFGAVWKIVQDVKKGCHARMDRCEHTVDGIIGACNQKKDDFITTKAFDRFEGHLTTRFNGLDTNVNHLTQRIDDLVLVVKNGNGKMGGH